MRDPDGNPVTAADITLESGMTISARLVFLDPDPLDGVPSELWEAQAGPVRRTGTSALGAASAVLNALQGLRKAAQP